MNGSLYATRPIQDGYALVRVPDVGGVRTYVSNQEVGRTTKRATSWCRIYFRTTATS